MSSNWTVVVHKKWSHRSFSLSLSLVGVGDILQSDRRYVCSGVSPSLSLRSRYVVVRVWCVGGGGGALFFFFVFFLSRLFFLLFVQKLDWKKLHEKIFTLIARALSMTTTTTLKKPTKMISAAKVVATTWWCVVFALVVVAVSFREGNDDHFSTTTTKRSNTNRKLLQRENNKRYYYTPTNEETLLPALNSNPSVGSNVMSIEEDDEYDENAYNTNTNNKSEGEEDDKEEEEEEEEFGGGQKDGSKKRSSVLSPSVPPVVVPRTQPSKGITGTTTTATSTTRPDDAYVTLRDGSRKKTTFWYEAARRIGRDERVRRFSAASAKLGMRTGKGLANSHRKAKDTLRKTKMMRDASDRQVNQAMLGILTVILVVWMVFGMFVIVPARERRRREWAEKVES